MVQLFLVGCGNTKTISLGDDINTFGDVYGLVSAECGLLQDCFFLTNTGGTKCYGNTESLIANQLVDGQDICLKLRVNGGIDFQHREGSKIRSGGQMSQQQAELERKERQRKLALETIDITKDPYIMQNHLGTFECKLCLTLHSNEGNYLAHTQGKRHQSNLARRAAMESRSGQSKAEPVKEVMKAIKVKIGRPGYKVTKSRDVHTKQRSLTFEVDYPEAEANIQPRHRFMSAYEQKVEPADKNYQYLLVACDPYETIAFKIPSVPVDKREGRFFTSWDKKSSRFTLQLFFLEADMIEELKKPPPAPPKPQLRYDY